ncbi:putative PurR-regulated permease PerM [Sagittula marina]|uniref:Putative PurR-regulated permease PerM n=1 Tax=Sagittula marina TaxID=943940 RepID=A0A7W6DP95_9RHOB|nr:TrgA family protein [Sagittula marina]MBB3986766.1 putative PurR-regulated permease PerM [Sagittula marina]
MPTAAKLVAAICLAVVAWFASEAVKPLFPEGQDFGNFNYWNTAIGLLCGWVILGSRAGRGFSAGISNGATAVVSMTLVALFVYATDEMINRAFRRFYDDPFEAVVAIAEMALEFGVKIFDGQVVVTLLVGGILSGILTEIAAKRWR